jgi:hypothetical protein
VGNVFDKNTLELPAEIPMDAVKAKNFFVDAKPRPLVSGRAGHPSAPSEGKKQ